MSARFCHPFVILWDAGECGDSLCLLWFISINTTQQPYCMNQHAAWSVSSNTHFHDADKSTIYEVGLLILMSYNLKFDGIVMNRHKNGYYTSFLRRDVSSLPLYLMVIAIHMHKKFGLIIGIIPYILRWFNNENGMKIAIIATPSDRIFPIYKGICCPKWKKNFGSVLGIIKGTQI